MYCSREYQLTSRFNQQYEKSTSKTELSREETVKHGKIDKTGTLPVLQLILIPQYELTHMGYYIISQNNGRQSGSFWFFGNVYTEDIVVD